MIRKRLPYRLSNLAMNDIWLFESFLKEEHEERAIALLHERIQKAIALLREFPEIGQWDENLGVRIFPVKKTRYILIFRVVAGILQILRIYHTSQTEDLEL